MTDLESARNPGDLYRYRATVGEPVPTQRPLFQGDVLQCESIPGVTETPTLAIVMSHPCTMRRRNGLLVEHLLVARVTVGMTAPLERYRSGYYGLLPLPELSGGADCEAQLDDLGRIRTDTIDLGSRAAALSDFGIALLQQRQVMAMSRHVVETAVLHQANAHLLLEAEMQEDWVESASAACVDPQQAISDFDAYFGPHRALARDASRQSGIRRAIHLEIEARYLSGGPREQTEPPK